MRNFEKNASTLNFELKFKRNIENSIEIMDSNNFIIKHHASAQFPLWANVYFIQKEISVGLKVFLSRSINLINLINYVQFNFTVTQLFLWKTVICFEQVRRQLESGLKDYFLQPIKTFEIKIQRLKFQSCTIFKPLQKKRSYSSSIQANCRWNQSYINQSLSRLHSFITFICFGQS